MTYKLKPVEVGYGERKFVFYLRMIHVEEEINIDQKLADINDADPDKYDRKYGLLKEALGKFSEQMPEKVVSGKGEAKRVALAKDSDTPFSAIESEFKERTPENERIIWRAYSLFKAQLDPDARFL